MRAAADPGMAALVPYFFNEEKVSKNSPAEASGASGLAPEGGRKGGAGWALPPWTGHVSFPLRKEPVPTVQLSGGIKGVVLRCRNHGMAGTTAPAPSLPITKPVITPALEVGGTQPKDLPDLKDACLRGSTCHSYYEGGQVPLSHASSRLRGILRLRSSTGSSLRSG